MKSAEQLTYDLHKKKYLKPLILLAFKNEKCRIVDTVYKQYIYRTIRTNKRVIKREKERASVPEWELVKRKTNKRIKKMEKQITS